MGRKPEDGVIPTTWTVELRGASGEYAHLLDEDNNFVAYGQTEDIEKIAGYLNEYEHVLKQYLKFMKPMREFMDKMEEVF